MHFPVIADAFATEPFARARLIGTVTLLLIRCLVTFRHLHFLLAGFTG